MGGRLLQASPSGSCSLFSPPLPFPERTCYFLDVPTGQTVIPPGTVAAYMSGSMNHLLDSLDA